MREQLAAKPQSGSHGRGLVAVASAIPEASSACISYRLSLLPALDTCGLVAEAARQAWQLQGHRRTDGLLDIPTNRSQGGYT